MNIIQVTTRHIPNDTRIYHKYCMSLKRHFDVVLYSIKKSNTKLDIPHFSFDNIFLLFKSLIKKKNCIIHFHDPDFIPFAVLISIFSNNKVIYDVHEDVPLDIRYKIWIPKIMRYLLSFFFILFEKFSSIFFTSIITATDTIKNKFLPFNSNVISIYNFPIIDKKVDVKKWEERKNQYCYVGSISLNRSIFEMIEVSELKSFILAGKFTNPKLEKDVMSLPNWDNVKYLGVINSDERNNLLNSCKIGLIILKPIKTFIDALPVKMFEYMERGIPVIASDFDINREFILENNCGILVNPNDTSELTKQIKFLLDNNKIAKQMGDNARNAILNKYNWFSESKKLIEHLTKIK